MPNILLIPTSIERSVIEPHLCLRIPALFQKENINAAWQIELCGFGLIAAAASTARLIERHRPDRVLLVGIAGSLNDSLSVGTACVFDQVTCHGIGVGDALSAQHHSSDQLGWQQLEGSEAQTSIGGMIRLTRRWAGNGNASTHHLLSVTAASANQTEATKRQSIFLGAAAEDMEGFAVALACEIAGVPLEIVRGISNRAGDRNHDRWQIKPALLAAAEAAMPLMCE